MAKILITDDSEFMRSILKELLIEAGYDVVEAVDGKDAIEKYKSENPDLLLLDIIMPEVDGLAVLDAIGDGGKTVVVSAVGQEKMVEDAKALGAIDYIVKPFDNEKVLEIVAKALA